MALFFAFLVYKFSPANEAPLVDGNRLADLLTVLLFGWCLLHRALA